MKQTQSKSQLDASEIKNNKMIASFTTDTGKIDDQIEPDFKTAQQV